MLSHKNTYYQDSNFFFQFERVEDTCNIHCECSNWKPSVYKKMCEVFNNFQKECMDLGIFKLWTISPNPKFCLLLGASHLGTLTIDNKSYEVMIWALKQS